MQRDPHTSRVITLFRYTIELCNCKVNVAASDGASALGPRSSRGFPMQRSPRGLRSPSESRRPTSRAPNHGVSSFFPIVVHKHRRLRHRFSRVRSRPFFRGTRAILRRRGCTRRRTRGMTATASAVSRDQAVESGAKRDRWVMRVMGQKVFF